MANAGQTCLAVERVYVVDQVYDRFLAKLVERASRVRQAMKLRHGRPPRRPRR